MTESLKFIEITDINDDLLLEAMDLYETAFPQEERIFCSYFIRSIKAKQEGSKPGYSLLAAIDAEDRLVGFMSFTLGRVDRMTYLVYLAVQPDIRGRGIGAACFNELMRRSKDAGMQGLMFEVEIPEEHADPVQRDLADRRIAFYKRLGAQILTGVRYVHSVGPHQPEILMNIMFCPSEPITPQQAFAAAKALFGDYVTQTGELELI